MAKLPPFDVGATGCVEIPNLVATPGAIVCETVALAKPVEATTIALLPDDCNKVEFAGLKRICPAETV